IFHHGDLQWLKWWKVLVLYGALLFLWWMWQARHRVVFEPFLDQSTSDSKPSIGMSALLRVELDRLRDLYRDVATQAPASSGGDDILVGGKAATPRVESRIKVDDVTEFLKTAVAAEATV